jgi:hypothetical protein
MSHPNDMTTWDEICCQRGHTYHDRKQVRVDLSKPHGYHDYPQVPSHLACRFPLAIWQWEHEEYAEMGVYCPAHDAVSRTIDELGIWEPAESILTLSILSRAHEDSLFVDFGAQIGWFCALACQARRDVVAFEADPQCMSIIRQNMLLNDWDEHVSYRQERVGPQASLVGFADRRIALAKIDIEGAEEHAVDLLWLSIEKGLVDHLLIEISPVFNDSYPDLVVRLLEAGYEAWVMPDKQIPPVPFEKFPQDLEANRLWPASFTGELGVVRETVRRWHQHNVLFSRSGARDWSAWT